MKIFILGNRILMSAQCSLLLDPLCTYIIILYRFYSLLLSNDVVQDSAHAKPSRQFELRENEYQSINFMI